MVEKEVMDLIQIFSWVATATGVCFAAYYYVMTLQNTEKARKKDMAFQKLNVNMIQHYDIVYDVMKMVDWDTLEEFYRKYFYWTNPEAFKKIVYIFNHYNALGILLKDGLVEPDLVFRLYSPSQIKQIYEKFKPWLDTRSVYPDNPTGSTDAFYSGVRYLYAETKKLYPTNYPLPRSLEESIENVKMRETLFKSTQK